MTEPEIPKFIWEVARQLRRRRLPLGIDDYDALRRGLAAGFGWSSKEDLCQLCVSLWAKSPEEADIVRAAFTRSELADWTVPQPEKGRADLPDVVPGGAQSPAVEHETGEEEFPRTEPLTRLGAFPPSIGAVDRSLLLVPEYPLTDREIAQAWRRLRRRMRMGPAVELDVAATVQQRSRFGVATPPVLVPRRRNTATLLLLIDRLGSMTPFHGYVDHIVNAIRNSGRLDDVREAYFHDLPGTSTDRSVLRHVTDPFRPDLDSVLSLIHPMREGRVYDDPKLTMPHPLTTVLDQLAEGTAVVVISDAGAARHRFDAIRLLDTIALVKAVRAHAGPLTWLNPVHPERWRQTTASQVHRYVPMHPLTRDGLDRAIDGLRGRPIPVEHPL